MLKSSNIDIVATLRQFSGAGVECALLVPTRTGLEKSILDATAGLRALLKQAGVHDYESQLQGAAHKVVLKALLFSRDQLVETSASLYRPESKGGDPRIWFSMLAHHAMPTDLIAVVADGSKLLVINCSQSDLATLLSDKRSAFWENYQSPKLGLSSSAEELLSLLRSVSRRGFVPTRRAGDTGVGYTLESLLGIAANSRKAPDYKGVEIKAGRLKSRGATRTSIFSQVPDWQISRLKSVRELLYARGKFNPTKGRVQLFHQIEATNPNTYGLILELDDDHDRLEQVCIEDGVKTSDVAWKMPRLLERLAEKHAETFWVKADCRGRGSEEEFHYLTATYTRDASATQFPLLIEAGIISVDYTIRQKANGAAKDQGFLFKIRQTDLPMLFRSPRSFTLSEPG